MSEEGDRTCPLCAEEMDLTDQQLKACKCGYEICVWCWHHLMDMAEKDDTEGRCPACRMPYDKEKIVGMAANCERMVAEINSERRLKSQKAKSKASEGRKHLSSVRVIQRNLVYIIGLPNHLADESALEHKEYFGQYGKVLKVSITKPASGSQHPSNPNTCSVYITYGKEEEAVRCIQSVHGFILEGRSLRACFGTTKYCHTWLRNMVCNNPDCLYLHDMGTPEDSFSKDEIISAYTRSRVQQITGAANNSQGRSGNVLPPPADEVYNNSSASPGKLVVKNSSNNPSNHVKVPPNGSSSSGRSSVLPAAASWGLRASSNRQPAASMACQQAPTKQKTDIHNDSSTLSSMTTSVTVTSDLRNIGGMKPVVSKECDLVHLNGRSGLEATESTRCQTTGDALAKVFSDPEYATMTDYSTPEYKGRVLTRSSISEDIDGQQSCGFVHGEVANGCVAVDGTIELEAFRMSSVDMENHLAIENTDISKHPSLICDYFSTGLDGNPFVDAQCCSEDGNDTIESLTSLSQRKAVMVSESSCVSSDIPNWSSELKKGPGSVMGDGLLPVDDRRLKISEAPATYPSYVTYSSNLLEAPHLSSDLSSNHGEAGNSSILGNADHRTADTLLPFGGSILSNGYNKNKFSSCELGCHDERSEIISNVERVSCSESVSADASKFDRIPDIDLGERSIISDILSLDLETWDKSSSSSPSLAQIFGETEKQNSPLKLLSSWKPQSNCQSRFSFARQEDFVNQATNLEPSFSNHGHVQKKHFNLLDSVDDRGTYQDNFRNSLEVSESLIDSLVSPASKAGVSRAQISAPPGFSVPSRSAPPGFSSQERTDRACVSPSSGNQMLESPLLRKQYQAPSFGNIGGSFGDVEFIDPAILAVGKGTPPLSMSNTCFDLAPTFPSQINAPDHDSRLRLLMQQSFSTHQNYGFSDHMVDRFSPLNDLYTPSALVERTQGNSLSHLSHMSLPQSKNPQQSTSQWDGWSEVQTGNDLVLSEILRNESLMDRALCHGSGNSIAWPYGCSCGRILQSNG
ncbi:hypothetical protein AAC387_Pa09g1828 [Persea americana]